MSCPSTTARNIAGKKTKMSSRKGIVPLMLALTLMTLSSLSFARGLHWSGFGFRGCAPRYFSYGYFWGVSPFREHGFTHFQTGNYGRVDFNVEPQEAKVYVNGAYIGIADDFNGGFFGRTATLTAGTHSVRIVSPDGRVEERKIYVMPGKETDLDLKFRTQDDDARGVSQLPTGDSHNYLMKEQLFGSDVEYPCFYCVRAYPAH